MLSSLLKVLCWAFAMLIIIVLGSFFKDTVLFECSSCAIRMNEASIVAVFLVTILMADWVTGKKIPPPVTVEDSKSPKQS